MSTNWPALLFAFSLTLLAGLSTAIGAGLAFFTKRTNTRALSLALGFSAGVMIYVAFVEILAKGNGNLTEQFGATWGPWLNVAGFFGGILLIAIIDRLVPDFGNPHETHRVEDVQRIKEKSYRLQATSPSDRHRLMRMGSLSALAIAIHNFPEGLATFTSALQDPGLGISIAIAIAIHNIPEGIAVSVPVFYATGKRGRAFLISFLSGLAEPIGAIVGYFLLLWLFDQSVTGFLFAGVAGIMVFISMDELLPTAREYDRHHSCAYGFVAGMAVMALSLLLF